MSFSFENNLFRELVEKYSTWNELRAYLESEEGGFLKIVDSGKNMCLVRYEKGVSKMDVPHTRWFRSVVWNTDLNRPMSVAPPKATGGDFPFNTLQEVEDAGVICQEFHEGFMINCFRTSDDNTLWITSRSKLNAAGKFYSEKSFRELFEQAYMNTKESPFYGERVIQDNSEEMIGPNVRNGEVASFYNFLVQHSEHRIVKKNITNCVILVQSGTVFEDGRVLIRDGPETFMKQSNLSDGPEPFVERSNLENIHLAPALQLFSYAKVLAESKQTEVQKAITAFLVQKDWQFQGLVFKDATGNRWRFRSDKYMAVKSLRGNSPSVVERFAQLYTQNLIHKYIEYYKEEAMPMMLHLVYMSKLIKDLYNLYVGLHITKTMNISQVNKMLHPHLYAIHGMYLTQLKPNNKKVSTYEIQLYLHKQPWQRIAFLLRNLMSNQDLETTI